ncbi:Ribosomal protein S18 acetylase RimI [Collimonas sp. OK242]|jgi:ribosomal protein S18 acetylase RimI-like enzyme|uniref:GNAT family N-acetyltransferase n=1 Tax=Collimonas sp. OK242 TaxID=1798195 RepID=UPI00089AA2C0|nr:GNAT family N-acetyltransferase [Collimonas sp. OK242]SDX60866.1 Ribosomal protein S18 acetylase RimI [Collimonas sp. OK242]
MKNQEKILPHRGIDTDLMFNRVAGDVTRNDQYMVVRTPDSPDYYFGNLLVLNRAPQDGERELLESDFARFVGTPPGIKHRTFLWPVSGNERFELNSFINAGYEFSENTVLIATSADLLRPARENQAVTIRRFRDSADWSGWKEMQLADNAGKFPEPEFLNYLAGKQATYQRMIADNLGDWWGAFIEGKQVANLGLFFDGETARFQAVHTAPSHRNQGICRTLVHHVALAGFQRAVRLVMVADENYHAARVYESLGFRRSERMASLCWWPQENR